MKIKEIIVYGVERLKNKNIEEANLKVKMLLMYILNTSKEYFIIHNEQEFPEEKMEEFENKIARLENNEPIQYITNNQSFFGLDFYVDENVLIPQPDTEILVEQCIKILQDVENNPQQNLNRKKDTLKILDLCTGSGAIGVSLAKNIENAKVYVSDISKKALEIAKRNAIQNKVDVTCIESNLFESIDERFYKIVSNPPYIETSTIQTLSEEVKREPILALDGGVDGLDFYRKIAEKAKDYLEDSGYLALEIGYNQKDMVIEILKDNNFRNIYCKKDFGGNNRVIVAQK